MGRYAHRSDERSLTGTTQERLARARRHLARTDGRSKHAPGLRGLAGDATWRSSSWTGDPRISEDGVFHVLVSALACGALAFALYWYAASSD